MNHCGWKQWDADERRQPPTEPDDPIRAQSFSASYHTVLFAGFTFMNNPG
jgi:hypothetical protein